VEQIKDRLQDLLLLILATYFGWIISRLITIPTKLGMVPAIDRYPGCI
jgi:hypothetical protein